MLDRFVDAGGTFVDTADVYGDGESERVLAPWLARRRDDVVLATKVRMPTSEPPGEGLSPDRVRAACDASLRRMGTDVIDLYQVHAPDPDVPLEDTLEALDDLVRAGKVRALGASNYPAWLLSWAVALQDRHGWSPFVSLQAQSRSSSGRSRSRRCLFCRAAGLGVLPWGPLGAGFLSGRHRRGEIRRGQPHGLGRRRHRGSAGASGCRAQLPRPRRRRGDRRRARRRPCRRWRSPGCCRSTASARRSSGRARSSSSRTCWAAPTCS